MDAAKKLGINIGKENAENAQIKLDYNEYFLNDDFEKAAD